MLLGAWNVTVCMLAGLVNFTGRVNRKKLFCVDSLETATEGNMTVKLNSV